MVLLQGWCGGTHCPAAFATKTPEDNVVSSGPSLFCASHWGLWRLPSHVLRIACLC